MSKTSKPAAPAAVQSPAVTIPVIAASAPQQEQQAAPATANSSAEIEKLKELLKEAEAALADRDDAPVLALDPTPAEILGELGESDLQKMRDILSLDAERKKAGAVSAEDAEMVRVYNKGRRRFDHIPWQSHPGAFCSVPRGIAKLWLRDWPNDFVAGDDALRSIDATSANLADANAKIKQLEAELAAAKK